MRPQHVGYGNGEHVIGDEADTLAAALDPEYEAELAHGVLARFAAPDYQPPLLPAVAIELQQMAQRSEFNPAEVVALLQRDALLAGKVLARAQSAAFAGASGGPLNLRDAVTRLGSRNLRDVVWEAALQMRVFRAPQFEKQMIALAQHASATAEIAAVVASYSPFPADYAFLCGLLHDVGIAGMLIHFSELKPTPDAHTMARLIAAHHAEISQRLASLWQLPDEVQWVVGGHHRVSLGGYAHPLSAIIAIADDFADRRGRGFRCSLSHNGFPTPCDTTPEDVRVLAAKTLQLTPKQTELIGKELDRRFAAK